MKPTRPLWKYRLAIASRALAATAGGYALAAASTAAGALALALAIPRVEAVLAATMFSWLVYAGAVAWVFYARTAWSAWAGVGVPALLLGACVLAPRLWGGAA
ncbi:DUF3649 domain-containing protein [Paracidovorax avenae]|uniref:DUF3649 domain-containing protein n=1 Tax=Paracidovorax avenae TaxID=80867 RepID=UPI000D2204C8|nr:DUF3649 domain-containing protein [Paracidovorax avenae]AVS98505.1 DUF3649 domain-containing protein [Paracidovorax avenae]AVT05547.1 DUF3649 domain-containing protein [Paracidovorax avenae]